MMNNNNPLGIKIIALTDCGLGVFVLGWFLGTFHNFFVPLLSLLGGCLCGLVPSIMVITVILLVILLIKSGVQIFKLNPKGREDHINFSSIAIFILVFPLLFSRNFHLQGSSTSPSLLTPIVCFLLIAFLSWSIFYLNRPNVTGLFKDNRL